MKSVLTIGNLLLHAAQIILSGAQATAYCFYFPTSQIAAHVSRMFLLSLSFSFVNGI